MGVDDVASEGGAGWRASNAERISNSFAAVHVARVHEGVELRESALFVLLVPRVKALLLIDQVWSQCLRFASKGVQGPDGVLVVVVGAKVGQAL